MWTVTAFTFKNKFKSKSFLITSLVLMILLTIVMHIPLFIQWFSSDEPDKIGVLNGDSSIILMLDEHFTSMDEAPVQIVWLDDQGSSEANLESAKKSLEDGEIDVYLQLEGDYSAGVFPKATLYAENTPRQSIVMTVQSALDVIKTNLIVSEIGLAHEDLIRLNTPAELSAEDITAEEAEKTTSEMVIAYALVYALTILIFFVLAMYGNMIASEITAEKSSRVMEILVSSVSPLSQMFGKVLGMFFLGIIQIGVFFVVIIANLLLPYNQELLSMFNVNLSDVNFALIVYFLVFYVLGYLLYAMIFASIGSLVSRTEELGQALTPVTFISLAGFYISIFGINAPESTFVTVTSFIPFFTPFVMFLRIGLADPAWWEIVLSIGLLAGSILLLGWLAAKIYRTGVLMYGKRPTFKELLKAMRSYKV